MIVIGFNVMEKFYKKHSKAKTPLLAWKKVVESTNFMNLVDLQKTFPSADYVKPYTIFNIGGNKFRLVVIVTYAAGVVKIDRIMTHAEYDKWNKSRR
mgnify:CR=1 FL=1